MNKEVIGKQKDIASGFAARIRGLAGRVVSGIAGEIRALSQQAKRVAPNAARWHN